MEERGHHAPDGFVTMAQAEARLGVSKATLQRIVKNKGLAVYRDQRDQRVRLLKIEDLDKLAEPVLE